MSSSRRGFFNHLAAGGGLAAVMSQLAAAQSQSEGPSKGGDPFWDEFYDVVDRSRGGRPREQRPISRGKLVRYLYSPPDGSALRWADQIKRDDLLDHPGDVTVSVVLGQFQPGGADVQTVQQFQSSQLRVDCVQTRKFMNVLAPAAWVALASIYTNNAGKLPTLEQLGFQSATAMSGDNKIILPGGTGKFAINVSVTKKESLLHKILREGSLYAGMAAPMLGFPSISIPAAKAFTSIFSALEERAAFLLNGPLVDAAATRYAVDAGDLAPNHLPLLSGQYVMVPDDHADQISQALTRLSVTQGYLVDSAQPDGPADRRQVKDVTYLSLKVTVAPLTTQPSAASTTPATPDAQKSAPKKK
jgi:hypothetical protein